jgi:hypothetical protein
MEIDDRGKMTFDRLYTLAETDSRRVAVGIAKANALWQARYPNSMPDMDFLDSFIKPFLDKEVLTRGLNEHRVIQSEMIEKRMHDMSRDVMVANHTIEQRLKLEHL